MPTLAAFALAALASAPVQLEVAPGTPCVAADSLAARLSRLGLTVQRPGALEVSVAGSADQVRVRGVVRASGATFERAVPATAEDCDAVERVVAALVRAWAEAAPLAAPQSPPPPVAAAPPAPTSPPHPAHPARPAARPALQAAPAPDPAAPTVPEIDASFPLPRASARERAAGSASELPADVERRLAAARANGQGAGASGLVGRLSLRAGIAGGPTPSAAPLGSASFHFGSRVFGVELEGGFAGAVSQSFEGGSIWAAMQWLTLSARLDLPIYTRMRFEALLGLRGTRIAAGSTGFDQASQVELYALGAYAAAGLDVRLVGPLSLVFRGVFTLRFPEERLVVDGLADALTLRVWQLGAEAGLAVWFP